MFRVEELLGDTNVRCRVRAASRKRVLQDIAELLAGDGVSDDELFEALMDRERLGSTGLGSGVAIPHCRLPTTEMRVALLSLAEAIDYEASDGVPVDLLFVLVVPADEPKAHLDALAALAETFAVAANCTALRACASDADLRRTMTNLLAQLPKSASA